MGSTGARRPYITHGVELLGALQEVNTAITGIEDVLAASRAEQDAETAESLQQELRQAYVTLKYAWNFRAKHASPTFCWQLKNILILTSFF